MMYTPAHKPPTPTEMRLLLSAPVDPMCYYGSAWNDGAVIVQTDGSGVDRALAYSRQFPWIDGCTWRADEKLVPVGHGRFRYEYTETILSCPAGAVPADKCPREGVVFEEPVTSIVPLAVTPTFSASNDIPDLSPWFGNARTWTASSGCPTVDDDDSSADTDTDSDTDSDTDTVATQ